MSTVFRGIDFWVALSIGALVTIGSFWFDPVELSRPILSAVAAICFTVCVGVWVGVRWISDRVTKDHYGEITGIIDPGHDAFRMPYLVVIFVAAIAGAGALTLAVLSPWVANPMFIRISTGLLTFLVVYTIIGFGSVIIITNRHTRRMDQVHHMRQKYEARLRESRDQARGVPDEE